MIIEHTFSSGDTSQKKIIDKNERYNQVHEFMTQRKKV